MKAATLWCARLGKIGLFLTLALLFGADMLMKALGMAVDEHGLMMASIPLVTLFAVLAVGGDIASQAFARTNLRTYESRKTRK